MRDKPDRRPARLPARCPKCTTVGMLYHDFEDGACWCCGWRSYDYHPTAAPIDDDGERHGARPGLFLARGGP